jgi:hypothetical protein
MVHFPTTEEWMDFESNLSHRHCQGGKPGICIPTPQWVCGKYQNRRKEGNTPNAYNDK